MSYMTLKNKRHINNTINKIENMLLNAHTTITLAYQKNIITLNNTER